MPDTTVREGWWIDGVHLEEHGVVAEDRQGWDDVAPMRGANVTLLGRHGTAWRRKRYDQAKKTITIGVHGTYPDGWSVPATPRAQRALYEQHLDALLRVLAPRHRLLHVERVHANGDRRQADCEITSVIAPAVAGDTYGQISIELVVPGVFWEDVDPTSYRLGYNTLTDGVQVIEVYSLAGATAPCGDARVVVTGACTGVSVHDGATGSGFTYPGTLTDGQTLTVDAGAFTATVNGVNALMSLVMTDQQLLELAPAPTDQRGPDIVIDSAGTSPAFTVTLVSRRKWLR